MTAFYELINKFIRYSMVGALNTVLCFFVMYVGFLFGLNYLVYTALGYVSSITLSFFMNLRYTFRVEGEIRKRLALFWIISLVNLAVVECIEYTMVEHLATTRLIAILCGMFWYTATGFLVNNFLVYRERVVKRT